MRRSARIPVWSTAYSPWADTEATVVRTAPFLQLGIRKLWPERARRLGGPCGKVVLMAEIHTLDRGITLPEAAPIFRTQPHNIEAEQALLGAMLVNNEVYHRVSEFLRAAHFYE